MSKVQAQVLQNLEVHNYSASSLFILRIGLPAVLQRLAHQHWPFLMTAATMITAFSMPAPSAPKPAGSFENAHE